jgi:glycosyltransferase involved in cell wall biosynthesis
MKTVVVMPAYNAEKTIGDVISRVPSEYRSNIIVVDDFSSDRTSEIAEALVHRVVRHKRNLGYGGNQKTCYLTAISEHADIVVMIHPDGQHDPACIPEFVRLIESGADVVLGSRFLGDPLAGGMPKYKYLLNKLLTRLQNFSVGLDLHEFHTGYRAYRVSALDKVNYGNNSNDFAFDNELLVQLILIRASIREIKVDTVYNNRSSSIKGVPVMKYALQVIWNSFQCMINHLGFRLPTRLFLGIDK